MKKLTISCATLASLFLLGVSTSANAAFTQIADDTSDHGRGSSSSNSYLYDINRMDVDWTSGNDTVNVRVYTNFTPSGNSYNYGDLFIGTKNFNLNSNSTTNWEYAFHLANRDDNPSTSAASPSAGWLINTDNGYSSTKTDNNGLSTGVMANHPTGFGSDHTPNSTSSYLDEGSWYQSGPQGNPNSFLNFTFNISSLGDPAQLAFRWAMTCANDVIRGVAFKPPGNQVAEPAAIALLLAGLAGLGMTKRRRKDRLAA